MHGSALYPGVLYSVCYCMQFDLLNFHTELPISWYPLPTASHDSVPGHLYHPLGLLGQWKCSEVMTFTLRDWHIITGNYSSIVGCVQTGITGVLHVLDQQTQCSHSYALNFLCLYCNIHKIQVLWVFHILKQKLGPQPILLDFAFINFNCKPLLHCIKQVLKIRTKLLFETCFSTIPDIRSVAISLFR